MVAAFFLWETFLYLVFTRYQTNHVARVGWRAQRVDISNAMQVMQPAPTRPPQQTAAAASPPASPSFLALGSRPKEYKAVSAGRLMRFLNRATQPARSLVPSRGGRSKVGDETKRLELTDLSGGQRGPSDERWPNVALARASHDESKGIDDSFQSDFQYRSDRLSEQEQE